jgi:hypothetical protein
MNERQSLARGDLGEVDPARIQIVALDAHDAFCSRLSANAIWSFRNRKLDSLRLQRLRIGRGHWKALSRLPRPKASHGTLSFISWSISTTLPEVRCRATLAFRSHGYEPLPWKGIPQGVIALNQ